MFAVLRNSCQKGWNWRVFLTVSGGKKPLLCSRLLEPENLICPTAVCREGEGEWNSRPGRMKNENPEKSLWRSEANAKAFHSKRPCVFRQTLRSFRTNALVSFLQALKWRFLRTLFSISSVNLEFPSVTEWRLISLLGIPFVAETAFLFPSSPILGSFLFFLNLWSFFSCTVCAWGLTWGLNFLFWRRKNEQNDSCVSHRREYERNHG